MSKRRLFACALVALLALSLTVQPAAAAEPADLTIEQPDYVDSDVVVSSTDAGTPIYEVSGSELLIQVENLDRENTTAFEVRDGPGSISFDEELGLYRFETDGQAGTSEVLIQGRPGGELVEFEAVIQVEQAAFTTRTVEADQELQQNADRWQEVASEAEQVDPTREPEAVVSDGLTYARFFDSPFSTLVQDIQGALAILVFRPGGWVILGILLSIAFIGVASGARYRNRTQKQLADFGDIQAERDEAFLNKARRILQQTDYNQLFPDDVAERMRDLFGRNPWIGFKSYLLLRSPTSVKGNVLKMMSQLGYRGYYRTDDEGAVAEAWVAQTDPGDRGDGEDTVRSDGGMVMPLTLSNLDYHTDTHRQFIDTIDHGQLDETVFELSPDDIDLDAVDLPISNREVDDAELIERLNPEFPSDFEHEEEMAEYLAQFIEFVLEHPHTDDMGRSKRGMDLISFLAEMDSTLADEAQFPVGHFMRRELLWVAENLETDAEIGETIDRLESGAVGADRPADPGEGES